MMDVMVQTFVKDDKLCKKYAQFASDLDRWHFRIIYWFMFVLNLMILFVASWTYTKYVISMSLIGSPRARVKLQTQGYMESNLSLPMTGAKKPSSCTAMTHGSVQEN